MSQDQMMKDLDALIKRAGEIEATGLSKKASIGDPLTSDNGTSAPQTGAQMASNNEEAGKHTAAKVDGGAETNPTGASVEMSTEGATAVSTDGQSGTQGADLDQRHQAANGDEGGFNGEPSDWDKKKTARESLIGTARSLAGELKKAAAALPVDANAAKASTKLASVLGKSSGQSEGTAAPLTAFDRFLAKRAMEAGGMMPPEAAGGMMPPEAAGGMPPEGEAAGIGAEEILQGLQSGAIGEEEAAQILQQAAASGALSEEDIAELEAIISGGAGGGAPAPMDPGMDPGMGDPMAEAGGDPMAMKVAMLDIGPDHPEYVNKLEAIHKKAMDFGYRLAVKTAQEIGAEQDAMLGGGEPPMEEVVGGMAGAPEDLAPQSPEEEQALQEVLAELGLDQGGADELMAAEVPQLDKVASFKSRVRGALLAKAAALRTAKQAQPQNKKD
jgi:hypothetical protein